ncbi:hypothetical protein [Variovorax sp. H27-G14]|uniref:hypothetical protein n=1 Tax=Variovorax sp. H27-G14 TaxID=3111914 RepID=UPI0038FCDDB8
MENQVSETPVDWPWEAVPVPLHAALASSLEQQLRPGPVYLLVDPFNGDVEPPIESNPRYAVPGDALRVHAEQLPYLVELKDTRDPLLEQSIAWAVEEHLQACANGSGPCRIGGWLQPHAPHDGAVLARQVGALLLASDAPNRGGYLRLADRRVLALLHQGAGSTPEAPPLLPAIDWGRQLKGIAHWIYLDGNFTLRALQGQPGAATCGPLQLEAAHLQCMADAEAINLGLMAWQRFRHPLPDDAAAQITTLLSRARRHGLRRPDDLAAYAAEALRFPAFEHYPDLPGRIARSLQTDQPLAERLAALRDRWADAPPPAPSLQSYRA